MTFNLMFEIKSNEILCQCKANVLSSVFFIDSSRNLQFRNFFLFEYSGLCLTLGYREFMQSLSNFIFNLSFQNVILIILIIIAYN
jgi:hypothetical protein